jgi:hypothetical protein
MQKFWIDLLAHLDKFGALKPEIYEKFALNDEGVFDLNNPDSMRSVLTEHLVSRNGKSPMIIICDTLRSGILSGSFDENSNANASRIMRHWRENIYSTGGFGIMIHHANKGQVQESGASAFTSPVECKIQLAKGKEGEVEVIFEKMCTPLPRGILDVPYDHNTKNNKEPDLDDLKQQLEDEFNHGKFKDLAENSKEAILDKRNHLIIGKKA